MPLKAKASRRVTARPEIRPRLSNDSRHAARQRDRRRERRIGFVLTLLFGGVFVGGFSWNAAIRNNTGGDETVMAVDGDAERRRAAVLFVPLAGNVCRRRVIDNSTWRIRDAGSVVCDEAVTWNSHYPDTKFHFAQRVDQLRSGFRATAGTNAK